MKFIYSIILFFPFLVQSQAFKPTGMVIPADIYMQNYDGYADAFLKDRDLRNVIAQINDYFAAQNYQLESLEQSLKSIENDDLRNLTKTYTISSADTWEKKVINIPAETSGAFSISAGLAPFTSSTMWDTSERLTGSQLADDVYTDSNIQAFSGARATVEMLGADQRYKYASDDGQYGIAARTYIDNIGTGVDLGFYFANYHSKVPYIQFKMPNGVFAQDILGAYTPSES